jgi:hypothetical protein
MSEAWQRVPSPAKQRTEVAWTITSLTNSEYVGCVYALDQQRAITKAIKEFGIKDAEQRRRRLVARRLTVKKHCN